MTLTTFSDYCLRILMFLAVNDDEKTTAANIAKTYDISFHHVAKASQWLVREGYLTSERGRGGGIALSRNPEAINIGQVLRGAQTGTVLVECMREDGGECCIAPACGLTGALAKAQSAFHAVLDTYTLADVVRRKTALRGLLEAHT